MNTLFEKFKEYAMTAEQAAKVRGGRDWCKVWNDCNTNVFNMAASTSENFESFDHYVDFINEHTGTCTEYFGWLCAAQLDD